MNDNDFYPYAYAKLGQRHYEAHPAYRTKRLSMIGALCGEKFSAPFMFEGYCNTETFEAYLEHVLVPTLQAGMIVIIDNASFHQSTTIRSLIDHAGCQLIYLPPYSPDLNPIEHYWHKIKTCIRKKMRHGKTVLFNAMKVVLKQLAVC